jgi:hypothetical protein
VSLRGAAGYPEGDIKCDASSYQQVSLGHTIPTNNGCINDAHTIPTTTDVEIARAVYSLGLQGGW